MKLKLKFTLLLPVLLAPFFNTSVAAANSGSSTNSSAVSSTISEVETLAYKRDAEVHYNLGLLYYKSNGVSKDTAKSFELFQKAAAQGHVAAQYMLGVMYELGKGVPKNDTKAIEWYEKAAAQGHANAQYNLGLIYYGGDGVPKDSTKAIEWLQKAAAQGDVNAQDFLDLLYEEGKVGKTKGTDLFIPRSNGTVGVKNDRSD